MEQEPEQFTPDTIFGLFLSPIRPTLTVAGAAAGTVCSVLDVHHYPRPKDLSRIVFEL